MPSFLHVLYPESTFGGFSDIDGTVAFYSRVNALIQPCSRVVDFGCGRGLGQEDPLLYRRNLSSLKGKVAKVIGLDVDDAGTTNQQVDEFHLLKPNGEWPLTSGCADLILCDWVIEHLPDPTVFFSEAKRILAPGGYLCIRTLNLLSYAGMASKIITNGQHHRILEKIKAARKEEDVFPTLYRCNTIRSMRRQMLSQGFRSVVYGYDPEPGYLQFSRLAYALGKMYVRFTPSLLRVCIFAFGQRS